MNPRPQRQCSILSRFSINMGSKEKAHKLRHFRNHSRASQGELVVRNLPANVGDVRDPGSVSGLERSPGGEHGNSLQYSCLESPHGQRSLAGYSPWGCKESDTTEAT